MKLMHTLYHGSTGPGTFSAVYELPNVLFSHEISTSSRASRLSLNAAVICDVVRSATSHRFHLTLAQVKQAHSNGSIQRPVESDQHNRGCTVRYIGGEL